MPSSRLDDVVSQLRKHGLADQRQGQVEAALLAVAQIAGGHLGHVEQIQLTQHFAGIGLRLVGADLP